MNSQQLILDRIATEVGRHEGVLLLHDPEYGNTGTLRALDASTLTQIGATSYNFQQDSATFMGGLPGEYVARHTYGRTRPGVAWVKGSIPELVDAVVAHLLNGAETMPRPATLGSRKTGVRS